MPPPSQADSPRADPGVDSLARRLAGRRVLVVGDVLLDRYVWGRVERVSPEAPVPVVLQTATTELGGGALNVARNVVAAGGKASLVGVVGDDAEGARVREICAELGVGAEGLVVDPERPTALKTRIVASGQQLLRVDRERAGPHPGHVEAALAARVREAAAEFDALVLSDYAKGAVSTGVANGAVEAARAAGIPVVADPKRRDFAHYAGADYLTPNLKEASEAAGRHPHSRAEVEAAGAELLARFGGKGILITRSEEGVSLVEAGGAATHVPAHAREVFDVTGAGDTLIAHFALALAAGLDAPTAARIGNAAAGVAVGKVGAAAVSPAELVAALGGEAGAKVRILDDLRATLDRLRAEGRRIVLTNGCFDLFHAGHVRLLREARALGDALVVALNSDASVRRIKGAPRPILPEGDRAAVLSALPDVDFIVFYEEDTPERVLKALRPDALVKGRAGEGAVVGADTVTGYGGRVVELPIGDAPTTGDLIQRLGRPTG